MKRAQCFLAILALIWSGGCGSHAARSETDQLPTSYRQEGVDILRVGQLLGSNNSIYASRQQALKWLSDVPKRFKVAELIMASSPSDLRLSFTGGGSGTVEGDQPSFDDVVQAIGRFNAGGDPMNAQPAARILKIGDSALFSYRHPGLMMTGRSGVSEAVVLGDHDPTKLVDGARVLMIGTTPPSLPRSIVKLYAKAYDEPSCDMCFQLLDKYGNFFPTRHVAARVREHPWFDGWYFPLIFRFEPDNSRTRRYATGSFPVRWPDVYSFYRMFMEASCETYPKRSCVIYNGHLSD